MTDDTLVDQAQRDTIANALDRTLFVEAGAGTGKTRSLVDRVLRVLATGRAGVNGIAAITFTEAAASELRDRIRDALERLIADADAAEREYCEAALADLDGAAVETIHAFCRRVLAAHPLQTGLPLAFDVLDATEGEGLFRDQWDAWFEDLLARADGDPALATPLLRAFALGATPDRLRSLASSLRGHWDRLSVTNDPVPQPELDVSAIADAVDVVCASTDRCTDPTDRMAQHLSLLASRTDRLRGATDDIAAVQALHAVARNARGEPWNVARIGAATHWPKGMLNDVRADLAAVYATAAERFDVVAGAAAAALTAEITRFVLGAADERRRAGRVEFQDLLVLTRHLLARQPEVRTAVRERYTHLFIDEFQDTDPLQAEIAFLLGCAPDGAVDQHWLSRPVNAGRLFFVGDPKQSIYRFRRADIDLYRRVRDRFDDSVVQITQNFRSVPAVIDWVNALLAERFAVGGSDRQAPYAPLVAARAPLGDAPAVYRIGGPREASAG
ncbi:MAG: UvrD-helicase domain-containing protein, partial [Chloroflexi bacterium]|nr:UvrD-helicase domain-containing protein [Chloroflexota bacterium]